jgi:hypothetical protein
MESIAKDFLKRHQDDYRLYDTEIAHVVANDENESYRDLLFALFACVQVDILSNPERWVLEEAEATMTTSLKDYKNSLSRILCDMSTLETIVENTWREHGYPIDDIQTASSEAYPCLDSCLNVMYSGKGSIYPSLIEDLQWLLQHTDVFEHEYQTNEEDTE